VGGYVNQAEKIIFETVYNNKDYENFIMEFSGNAIFKFFGLISVSFINAFQSVLKRAPISFLKTMLPFKEKWNTMLMLSQPLLPTEKNRHHLY
jgi:hypothetical protein